MKQVTAPLCVLVLTAACGARTPTMPTTPASAVVTGTTFLLPPSGLRQIGVGDEVTGTLDRGDFDTFELLARSDGKLVLRLSWESEGTFELWLDNTLFVPSRTSPMTGKMQVVAGGRYRVKVADFAARDYGPWSMRYVMTIAME